MTARPDPLWMQTFTGKAFRFPPTVDMLDIVDIAHALAHQCRYNGHSVRFYSVAEHSVLMARWFKDRGESRLARAALLHDAGEAYVSDVPRPLKPRVPAFGELSDEVDRLIAKRWGVDIHAREIKDADWRILTDEKVALTAEAPEAWHLHPAGGLGVVIRGWTPETAKREFLAEFEELFLGKRPASPKALPACCYAAPHSSLAARLYAAYNRGGDPKTAGLNYRGEPCPSWEDLPPNVQEKWEEVASRLANAGISALRTPSFPSPPPTGPGLSLWARFIAWGWP